MLRFIFRNPSLYVMDLGRTGKVRRPISRAGPAQPHVPGRSLGHLVPTRTVQNHPDPQVSNPQNTDLDVLNPTILFIWRETAGKCKIIFGFHSIKLSVGPTTSRTGIIIPHTQGGGGQLYGQTILQDKPLLLQT